MRLLSLIIPILTIGLLQLGGGNVGLSTCPQGNSFADGCASAPSGTPQFQSYLNTGTIINAGTAGVGSGYTNGTGYAWTLTCSTTNATGTVDVVAGALSNVQITNAGKGCTAGENNVTTPAGAGAGTGGQIQAYSPGFRPAWNVAGVDYAVGPTSTPTLDPATISISGVTVNTTTCAITVSGNNVTISGYDFTKTTCNSGAGGWHIAITGQSATITNFKALAPQSALTPVGFIDISGGGNHVISYCSIDGNVANQTGASDGWLIRSAQSSGNFTVNYCLLTNAYGDNITTSANAALVLKYNVLTNSKFNTGSHGEYVDAVVGTINSSYNYNLTIQNYADGTGFPGELSSVWENNNGSLSTQNITGSVQSNNTSFLFGTAGHTASGLPDSHAATTVWSDQHSVSSSFTNVSPTVQSNYVAVSGIVDTVPGVGFLNCDATVITPSVSGNINMNSNATIVGSAPCN